MTKNCAKRCAKKVLARQRRVRPLSKDYLHDGYVNRQGRELIVTAKGMALITLLRGIGVTELCSPEMTGEWESKLKRMAKGAMKRKEFMTADQGIHA